MQKENSNKTNKLLMFQTEQQVFDKMIKEDHPFRKLEKIIDFKNLAYPLRDLYKDLGQTGIDISKGFKALVVQFWEDYSDRQMERALEENLSVKWFCGFGLTEDTPDHSYFGKLRKRIGAERLESIFNQINGILRKHGLFGDTFKFIDASAIITKTALWEERDKAIKKGEEKLNNANVENYASDKDAKWGAKSKHKIWFGYKRHHVVDMRNGLIETVLTTPANVLDFQVLDQICPQNCMTFMDKLYDVKSSYPILEKNNCHSGIIKKNNNKLKNKDLDKWISSMRMPHEGNFSKLRKRARYRGLIKVGFQCVFEAIAQNLKKAVTVLPLEICAN